MFLPGTGGDPAGVRLFLDVAADAGYRVVSLSYDNEPEVMQICARDPDPTCPGNCRQSRVFGGSGPIDTPSGEAIVARLTKLLQFLDNRHPEEGWRGYLVDGAPDWHRIAVAGHSQGGGMAVFLGKRVAVARVPLLSGPLDYVLPSRGWLYLGRCRGVWSARPVACSCECHADRSLVGALSSRRALRVVAGARLHCPWPRSPSYPGGQSRPRGASARRRAGSVPLQRCRRPVDAASGRRRAGL